MRKQITLRTKIRKEGLRVPSPRSASQAFGGYLPQLLLTGAMALLIGVAGGYRFAQHQRHAEHRADVVLATHEEPEVDRKKLAQPAAAQAAHGTPADREGRSPFELGPSPSSPLPDRFKLPASSPTSATVKNPLSTPRETKKPTAAAAAKTPSFLSRSQPALAEPAAGVPAPSAPAATLSHEDVRNLSKGSLSIAAADTRSPIGSEALPRVAIDGQQARTGNAQ